MTPKLTHLLWVDLETSGLDVERDDIIEFGGILTDIQLNILDKFSWIVEPQHTFEFFMARIKSNEVVHKMHTENGLLESIRMGWSLALSRVEEMVEIVLKCNEITPGAVALAGSGVGVFDHRFIHLHMPQLSSWLAYPVIDVGVIRRFVRDVAKRPDAIPSSGDASTKTHRAGDDVAQHLQEAVVYQTLFQSLVSHVT